MEFEVGDEFGAFVGEGADVDVGAVGVFFDQLDGDAAEVVDGVGDLHHKHPAAEEEALVVFAEAEDVHRFLIGVPVAADAFEDGGAVVEGVGQDTDAGVLDRH